MVLGATVGCPAPSVDASADRAVYLDVLSNRKIEPAEGLERCGTIVDGNLAGDCALHVVMVEARRPSGRPGQWCETVPVGTWRDECWFVSAESAKRARNLEEAARFCLEAGAFRDDCAQHLWQSEVHGLIHRRGSRAFADVLPKVEAVYDRWAPLLADQSDFDARFWAKFFQNGFEGQGGFVDLSHCDVLAKPHAARCEQAGTEMYARELAPRLSDARVDLCAVPEPEDGAWSRALIEAVPTHPDARLDRVVADRRAQCPSSERN